MIKLNRKIDKLVISAISAIEKMNIPRLKPRIITLTSFIKGTQKSPYYEYYKKYTDICGQLNVSKNDIVLSCNRLVEKNKIVETNNGGRSFYKTSSKQDSFLSNCSKNEQHFIKQIENYITNKNSNFVVYDKTNRYIFTDEKQISKDNISYAWVWFTRINGELVFKYKFNQNDNEKSLYNNNVIVVNSFQLQTIFNLIDFVLK